jgi:hypothetical protein
MLKKYIAREKFLTSPLVDDHHITYLTKLNSTKLFWATTRAMQNTSKADKVTHMKTKPQILVCSKISRHERSDFRATPPRITH